MMTGYDVGEMEEEDATMMVRAIIHCRNHMIAAGFFHFRDMVIHLSQLRNHRSTQCGQAVDFAANRALFRGFRVLLALSPHKKMLRAVEWRNKHLEAMAFGAWVRYCTSIRQDRNDDLKAVVYHERCSSRRALQNFMKCVLRYNYCHRSNQLADIFYHLLCYKRYLFKFKQIRSCYTIRKYFLTLEKSLREFLENKAKRKVYKLFTLLLQKCKRKNEASRKILEVRSLVFYLQVTCPQIVSLTVSKFFC